MNDYLKKRWTRGVLAGVMTALMAGLGSALPSAYAAGMIKADEDKWISVGIGIRLVFDAIENQTGPPPASGTTPGTHYSNNFRIPHQRLYINGQIHKYVKFTFNTECTCGRQGTTGQNNLSFGSNSSIILLDAIGKFEFNEKINLWVGRTLVPNERAELAGPFNHATFEFFRTPFFPADFSENTPGSAGNNGPAGSAGLYGRDNGAVFYGKIHPFGTHLQYTASVFTGLRGGPNDTGSLMYAGRLQWNLLNDEENTGYYTRETYFGTAGDILAIAGNVQHQKDGAGSITQGRSDFTGLSVDLLFEKPLPNNMGVFTFNGEFKRFFANYGAAAAANPIGDCFCIFNGHSWTVLGLYLIPQEIGIGRFQPYVRYTNVDPLYSDRRAEWETGINYVIDGFDARVSAYYRYGDLNTKGTNNFGPNVVGDKVDSFHVALQLQY